MKLSKFMWLLSGLSFGMFLTACDRVASGGRASIVIQMPTTAELQKMTKSDVSGLALVDLQRLCFAVNVMGPGIISTPAASCDIERGTFAGSVGNGEQLELLVDVGAERTFELYAFMRDAVADKCPAVLPKGWSWPLKKTYYLGKKSGVNVLPVDTPPIEIPFTVPIDTQNIAVQNAWPAVCLGNPAPSAPSVARMGRVVSGSTKLLSPNGYSSYSKISPLNDEQTLGTNYKIRNWKVGQ